MIHLAGVDIALILAYFVAVFGVGWWSATRTKETSEDFLLAGRRLTLPIFVMTLVSTFYGGVLGVGEYTYSYGLSNWVTQGLPYYAFAAFFALVLAGPVRKAAHFSIPDQLERVYGRKTALLGAALVFVLASPAPYLLMLAMFLQLFFGWSLLACVIVAAIAGTAFLFAGGFRSDVETDVLEFTLMFLGFALVIPYCVLTYGGWDYLVAHLPPLHLTWHGGNTGQYVVVWFFIALWTLVDPSFHQRCAAAKDAATARKGILISLAFWALFDLLTTTAGLYARAALPDLAQPLLAFPMLAEAVLPPLAKGAFYVGMLATVMSTLNTSAFLSAQTLGRDIALRLRGTAALGEDRASVRATRIGLVVSCALAAVLCLAVPSVVNLWYAIGTVIIPGLLVPLVSSYFPSLRVRPAFAFASMLLGWLVSSAWLLAAAVPGSAGNPLGIEPMYPGLLLSLLVWAIGRLGKLSAQEVL